MMTRLQAMTDAQLFEDIQGARFYLTCEDVPASLAEDIRHRTPGLITEARRRGMSDLAAAAESSLDYVAMGHKLEAGEITLDGYRVFCQTALRGIGGHGC